MAKDTKKKIKLLKLKDVKKPQKIDPKNYEQAYINAMKNYDKLVNDAKKMKPMIDKEMKDLISKYDKKSKDIEEYPEDKLSSSYLGEETDRIKDKMFWAFRKKISRRNTLSNEIQDQYKNELEYVNPFIFKNNPGYIKPNCYIELTGVCFGEQPGKVRAQISSEEYVELEIEDWNETYILAILDPSYELTGLRPYEDGRIWVESEDGKTSNAMPLRFKPTYSLYWAEWDKHLFGCSFYIRAYGTLLKNKTLGDNDFKLIYVSKNRHGDGSSNLTEPYAEGQNLGQGWEMKVYALDHEYLTITYQLRGPRGITPPKFNKLRGWFLMQDISP